MEKKRFCTQLSVELIEKIKKVAEERGVDIQDLMTDVISASLGKPQIVKIDGVGHYPTPVRFSDETLALLKKTAEIQGYPVTQVLYDLVESVKGQIRDLLIRRSLQTRRRSCQWKSLGLCGFLQ